MIDVAGRSRWMRWGPQNGISATILAAVFLLKGTAQAAPAQLASPAAVQDVGEGASQPFELYLGPNFVRPQLGGVSAGISSAFPLQLGTGFPLAGGIGSGSSATFALFLGAGFGQPTSGVGTGSSTAFALYLGRLSERFAVSPSFPLDVRLQYFVRVTTPTSDGFWLTAEQVPVSVAWSSTSTQADHVRASFSSDGGNTWQALSSSDLPVGQGVWNGSSNLIRADTTGAKIRLDVYGANSTHLGSVYSADFAAGNRSSIRLAIERNSQPTTSSPIIFWNPVSGTSYYHVEATADTRTSCAGGFWTTDVSPSRAWVLFDRSAWSTFPATRCNVTIDAYNSSHIRIGSTQTMMFERCKLSDLDPNNTEAYTSKPPVVLVHGWTEDQSVWYRCNSSALVTTLINGPVGQRFHPWSFEYPNLQAVAHSAFGLRAAIGYLVTPQTVPVGIIAHSMGGLVARAYLEGLAVDPKDDSQTGVREGGATPVSRLITLATPHLGEPWSNVDVATLWNTVSCDAALGSDSRRDLSSSSALIAELNSHSMPGIGYFFAAGQAPYGETIGPVRNYFQSPWCDLGSDGTVDLCSARGDCGGRFPTALAPLAPGGSLINAQYDLGHARMALPGNIRTDCNSSTGTFDLFHQNESLRLLSDVLGFLRCGSCLVTSSCPADNRRAAQIHTITRFGFLAQSAVRRTHQEDQFSIAGATVSLRPVDADPADSGLALTTDGQGLAAMTLARGTYVRKVGGRGWITVTDTLVVDANTTEMSFEIGLERDPQYGGPVGPVVAINGGAASCVDSTVSVTLACTGATQMKLSATSTFASSEWTSVPGSPVAFTLHGGKGLHTLFAKFRDDLGRESDVASAVIALASAGAGRVQVTSGGVEAGIMVDGRSTGLDTPATVADLEPGFHTFTAIATGYRCISPTQSVYVDSGATVSTAFALIASAAPSAPGWLQPTIGGLAGPLTHLTWSRSTAADVGTIVTYDLRVFADSSLAVLLTDKVGTLDTSVATPPLRDSTTYFAALTARNSHGVPQASAPVTRTFRYDATPPSGTLTSPQQGDVLLAGQSGSLITSASDWGGVSQLRGRLSFDGGRTFPDTIARGVFDDSLAWVVPDTSADSCEVEAVFVDGAGNISVPSRSGIFRIVRSLTAVSSGGIPNAFGFSIRPVPARTSLTLVYELPRAASIDLTILDIQGRVAWNHREATGGAGVHTLVWTGQGTGGNRCPPGIYFARARLGETSFTRRVVLLQ